ncbi:DNA-cytosine methyltransferase [Caulobacter phage BL94]|nr:DNA-cytosine methyltransferase [Caulobacter phage BL94]
MARFLSLFSGIEAASVAWKPLGWTCVGVAEFDKAASKQLAKHYPDIPNLGDVTKITEYDIKALGLIDVVVFGSPCQDLSLSGRREGLKGSRSGLFFHAIKIIAWARKHCGLRFALWENVPGAFSSNKGRDFAAVVGHLAGCEDPPVPKHGWGTEGVALGDNGLVEWCVLDAQWFNLAQRRTRVFALADFGAWASRSPILLEPESLRGDHPPRREAGEEVTGALVARTEGGGFPGTDGACQYHVVPVRSFGPSIIGALTAACGPNGHGGSGLATDKGAEAGHIIPVLAFGGNNTSGPIDVATARNAHGGPHGRLDFESETFLVDHWEVRRLTPLECERLQGFEDGYTAGQADGPRYRQLGNSMAVPVMAWIGRQIDAELTV